MSSIIEVLYDHHSKNLVKGMYVQIRGLVLSSDKSCLCIASEIVKLSGMFEKSNHKVKF